jgi:hypothetical protein
VHSSDPLDDLLDRANRAPEPPAGLAIAVRRELAARRAAATPGWTERLEAAFARPSFATAFVVACILLGLFLAEARLSRLHAAHSAQLARNYLQLVDPLLPATPPSDTSPP